MSKDDYRTAVKFNYNLLNNRIAQVCGSQYEFARRIGISFEELQNRLAGIDEFRKWEIEKGIDILFIMPYEANIYYFE